MATAPEESPPGEEPIACCDDEGPLWDSSDVGRWQFTREHLWDWFADIKSQLVEEERWIQETLPTVVQKRDPPQLSKPELVRLVHWKVGLRGKWRPRLQAFAEALPDEQVEIATRKGFKALGSSTPTNASVKEALTIITALKGIGPATASAILQVYNPAVPFTSDEAMQEALRKADYTPKAVLLLSTELSGKAKALNAKAGSGANTWTARDVEMCLYIEAKRRAMQSDNKDGAKKRKR